MIYFLEFPYYLSLWRQTDQWWWSAYGNDADGFTLWDYMSLMAAQEGNAGAANAAAMAEAGVRVFYQRVEEGALTGITNDVYGLLDWFASFSQSQAGLIGTQANPEIKTNAARGGDFSGYKAFSLFGSGLRNPGAWQTGQEPDRPYSWGNATAWNRQNPGASAMFALNTNIMFVYIPDNSGAIPPNPFYVPPGCAVYSWVDHSLGPNACSYLP